MNDWHTAFRVVAHEVRSPAGVISGYIRLINSGRLDDTAREDALRQVERAAGNIGEFAQQASDLSGWVTPRTGQREHKLPLKVMIDTAASQAVARDRLEVVHEDDDARVSVEMFDALALSAAITSIIDATSREMENPRGAMTMRVQRSASDTFDVIIGPSTLDESRTTIPEDARNSFNLACGGLGLRVILGAAVLDAHGIQFWSSAGHKGLTNLRIPVVQGQE